MSLLGLQQSSCTTHLNGKNNLIIGVLGLPMFKAGNNWVIGDGDGRADKKFKNFYKSKKSKNNTFEILTNIIVTEKPTFLTPSSGKAFN